MTTCVLTFLEVTPAKLPIYRYIHAIVRMVSIGITIQAPCRSSLTRLVRRCAWTWRVARQILARRSSYIIVHRIQRPANRLEAKNGRLIKHLWNTSMCKEARKRGVNDGVQAKYDFRLSCFLSVPGRELFKQAFIFSLF